MTENSGPSILRKSLACFAKAGTLNYYVQAGEPAMGRMRPSSSNPLLFLSHVNFPNQHFRGSATKLGAGRGLWLLRRQDALDLKWPREP